MRSVTDIVFNRLVAQKKEADLHGLDKVSENVSKQLEKYADNIRADEDFYVYSDSDLKADVEGKLWDAIIRVADFYNRCPDVTVAQSCVDWLSKALLDDVRVKLGVTHGVGEFEPTVPG